jgi:hypothetical protein
MSRHAKSRQAAAMEATQAAETLLTWLHTQPKTAAAHRPTGDEPATPPEAEAAEQQAGTELAPNTLVPPKPADTAIPDGPAPDADRPHRHAPQRLPHPDWLLHRLCVSGSPADLAAFRAAAAGAGTIPWELDLERMAEDWFHLLMVPPAPAGAPAPPPRRLSLAGARILAGQLREAVAQRHALAMTQVGRSEACPFDLHALVPVPPAILQRGPDDPEALAWLWQRWGTTAALRHVAIDAEAETAMRRSRAPEEEPFVVTFWSADWTPWRALARIAADWPRLRFETRPIYEVP